MKRSHFIASIAGLFSLPFFKVNSNNNAALPSLPIKESNSFGYATSTDGIVWTKVDALPKVLDIKFPDEIHLKDISINAPGWQCTYPSSNHVLFEQPITPIAPSPGCKFL